MGALIALARQALIGGPVRAIVTGAAGAEILGPLNPFDLFSGFGGGGGGRPHRHR